MVNTPRGEKWRSHQIPWLGDCGSAPLSGVIIVIQKMILTRFVFSCLGRTHLLSLYEDCTSLSLPILQLWIIRQEIQNAKPSVLPNSVPSFKSGLEHLGTLIGGTPYAYQWFAEWTDTYFRDDPSGQRLPPADSPVISTVNCTGDTSSSATSPNYHTNLGSEERE